MACKICSCNDGPHFSIIEDTVHLHAKIIKIIPNNPLSFEIEIPANDKDYLCYSKSLSNSFENDEDVSKDEIIKDFIIN
jgi:hypothetical protein